MMGFLITNEGQIIINVCELLRSICPYAIVFVIAFTLGIIVCSLRSRRESGAEQKSVIQKIYCSFEEKNIENIVFFISIFLVLLSIILQCFNIMNGFSNTIINIFGTLIVSWIATKKNSEEEIRKKEQENAKKMISDCIANNHTVFAPEQISVRDRARDQMEHIETGIETSLFDWEDMMSQEDINMVHGDRTTIKRKAAEAADTIPGFDVGKFESEEQMNQEEA